VLEALPSRAELLGKLIPTVEGDVAGQLTTLRETEARQKAELKSMEEEKERILRERRASRIAVAQACSARLGTGSRRTLQSLQDKASESRYGEENLEDREENFEAFLSSNCTEWKSEAEANDQRLEKNLGTELKLRSALRDTAQQMAKLLYEALPGLADWE